MYSRIQELRELFDQTYYIAHTVGRGVGYFVGFDSEHIHYFVSYAHVTYVAPFYSLYYRLYLYSPALYVKYNYGRRYSSYFLGVHEIKAVMSWLNWVRVEVVLYVCVQYICILYSILPW